MMRLPVALDGGRRPRSRDLEDLFDKAARARVREGGVSEGRPLGGKVLAEAEGQSLTALRDALRIREDGPAFRCLCHGDLAVELLDARGGLVAALGLHHGVSLRLDAWDADAELADGRALFVWLAARGEQALLDAYDHDAASARRRAAQQEAWLASAPVAIMPHLPSLFVAGLPAFGVERYARAAHDLIADRGSTDAASALLAWYGRGAGPYSGHPAYEDVAAGLLDAVGLEAVLQTIETSDLSSEATAGAARFLATHGATRAQKDAVARLISPPRRDALREVARATGIDDDVARFDRALGPMPAAVPEGMDLVAAGRHGHLRSVQAVGDRLIAVDGATVVRFDPGSSDPVLLLALPSGSIPPLAAGDDVVVTERQGRVVRLPLTGGAPIEVAPGPGRTTDWVVHEAHLYAIREGAVLRVPIAGGAWETIVPARSAAAWGLVAGASGIHFMRGEKKRTFLFGEKDIVSLERWQPDRRTLETLVEERAPDGFLGFRLTVSAGTLFWSSGSGRVAALPVTGGPSRRITVEGDVHGLASAPDGAYALLARDDAHVVVHVSDRGAVQTLVQWRGGPPVLGIRSNGASAYVVLGDRVARLAPR
ncbi:Hypothetical protein A7982_04506 [Minicystis rosea]|nr:Hypothetical protein A7982_04506 [Minicystis rosea]